MFLISDKNLSGKIRVTANKRNEFKFVKNKLVRRTAQAMVKCKKISTVYMQLAFNELYNRFK